MHQLLHPLIYEVSMILWKLKSNFLNSFFILFLDNSLIIFLTRNSMNSIFHSLLFLDEVLSVSIIIYFD